MYRWLLCWRYLRTRYIALASVVSVMLGVATLIIVNSVMDGFTTEMQERMHGILSDVVIESHNPQGMPNHERMEQHIRSIVGDDLAGLTTVVHVPAMVNISHRGESINRQINLIGIDTESYAGVSDFSKFLLHPENQKKISFALHESGYAPDRDGFPESGWVHRRHAARIQKRVLEMQERLNQERQRNELLRKQIDEGANGAVQPASYNAPPDFSLYSEREEAGSLVLADQSDSSEDEELAFPTPPPQFAPSKDPASTTPASSGPASSGTSGDIRLEDGPMVDSVKSRDEDVAQIFDPEVTQRDGIVLGISIGTTRYRDADGNIEDYYYVQPGDDVQVTFPSAGNTPRAINEKFTVVDFYESQMSEYDATFAFVPLDRLQHYRGMRNSVTSIQLRLKEGADLNAVRDELRAHYPPAMMIQVNTWRDLQGPLLAAVQMETTILNILLFLIIAVAGFGILATFFMIVVEKTKDIGILKSLGASGVGVASIFLGYGVLLGAFGAGVGAVAGLIFVANINSVADALEIVTGQEVFDPTVYYFDRIPTIVHPSMVVWVIFGAVCIAVAASVLPSIRAARMHPVEALRYE